MELWRKGKSEVIIEPQKLTAWAKIGRHEASSWKCSKQHFLMMIKENSFEDGLSDKKRI